MARIDDIKFKIYLNKIIDRLHQNQKNKKKKKKKTRHLAMKKERRTEITNKLCESAEKPIKLGDKILLKIYYKI